MIFSFKYTNLYQKGSGGVGFSRTIQTSLEEMDERRKRIRRKRNKRAKHFSRNSNYNET